MNKGLTPADFPMSYPALILKSLFKHTSVFRRVPKLDLPGVIEKDMFMYIEYSFIYIKACFPNEKVYFQLTLLCFKDFACSLYHSDYLDMIFPLANTFSLILTGRLFLSSFIELT